MILTFFSDRKVTLPPPSSATPFTIHLSDQHACNVFGNCLLLTYEPIGGGGGGGFKQTNSSTAADLLWSQPAFLALFSIRGDLIWRDLSLSSHCL
jgi:hypothetical protein